jgi:hypothetical protein
VYRLAGIKTANEIREGIGLEPVEGGDVLWQPVNVQIVGPTAGPITPGVDTGARGLRPERERRTAASRPAQVS